MRGRRIDPEDIVGKKFGKLTVLEYLGRDEKGPGKHHLYKCQCECGKIKTVRRMNLMSGKTVSCGCIRKGRWLIDPQDIVGKRYGRLVVEKYLGAEEDAKGYNRHFYQCKCDCGNVEKVQREGLISGDVRSCGCLRKEAGAKVGSLPRLDPEDIVGKKFENLTVEKYIGARKYHGDLKRWYLCRCECGNTKEVERSRLMSGLIKSCGCLRIKVKDFQDIVGQTFGKLTVLEYLGKDEYDARHSNLYRCKCECGNEVITRRDSLVCGHAQSCGCARGRKGRSRIDPQDIIGKKFGRLTVKEYLGRTVDGISGRNIYLCQCECGNETEVQRSNLLAGNTRSCGCLRNELNAVVKSVPKKRRNNAFPYDIIGTQEGKLICLDCLYQRKDRNWVYLVKCEKCGHEFELDRGNFLLGKTPCPQCGKSLEEKFDPMDIVGQRFGRLTVTDYAGTDAKGLHTYLCKCDCGRQKIILRYNLTSGKTRSCGCLRNELLKKVRYEKPKI